MRIVHLLLSMLSIATLHPPQLWRFCVHASIAHAGLIPFRAVGLLASYLPESSTNDLVNTALKAAVKDTVVISPFVESIAEGATKAVLASPRSAAVLVSAAAGGAMPVMWKAMHTQLVTTSRNAYDVAAYVHKYTFSNMALLPRTNMMAADLKSPRVNTIPVDTVRLGLIGMWMKSGDALMSLMRRADIARIAIAERASERVVMDAMTTLAEGENREMVARASKSIADRMLLNPAENLGMARNFGKTAAEQALLNPGAVLAIAVSSAKGSLPVLAFHFYTAVSNLVFNIGELVKIVPTQSMLAVQAMAKTLHADAFKQMHPIIFAPKPLAIESAAIGGVKPLDITGTILTPGALATKKIVTIPETPESLALADKLKVLIAGFKVIGVGLAGIGAPLLIGGAVVAAV